MPDNETQKDIMARLLAQKKQSGSSTPQHNEFSSGANIRKGGQTTFKPQKPGGNRGRG